MLTDVRFVVGRNEGACGDVRGFLRYMLSQCSAVPQDAAFEVELLSGEAVSNAYRYGRGTDITCEFHLACTRFGGRIYQSYRYDTDVFDTTGELPDTDKLHGRGLYLLRTVASVKPIWNFADGALKLSIVKTWATGRGGCVSFPGGTQ